MVANVEARPPLTAAQIQTLLPERGRFTFPAPYNTAAIRLTNSSDCDGTDCVNPVGYSYWRNINNHVDSDTMLIFLTLYRTRGGGGHVLRVGEDLTIEPGQIDFARGADGPAWVETLSKPPWTVDDHFVL